MLHPSFETFSNKVVSRYSLVVATAKRARQLVSGAEVLVDTESTKPVTIAMEEISSGKVFIEKPET